MAQILGKFRQIYSINLYDKIFEKSLPICSGIGAMIGCGVFLDEAINKSYKIDIDHGIKYGKSIILGTIIGTACGAFCGTVMPIMVITSPITLPSTIGVISYHKFIKKSD